MHILTQRPFMAVPVCPQWLQRIICKLFPTFLLSPAIRPQTWHPFIHSSPHPSTHKWIHPQQYHGSIIAIESPSPSSQQYKQLLGLNVFRSLIPFSHTWQVGPLYLAGWALHLAPHLPRWPKVQLYIWLHIWPIGPKWPICHKTSSPTAGWLKFSLNTF